MPSDKTSNKLNEIMSKAEEWRESLFDKFSVNEQILAFYLYCLTEEKIRLSSLLRPNDQIDFKHARIREEIFSLEWALRSLNLPDSSNMTDDELRNEWNPNYMKELMDILKDIYNFYYLRDLIITTKNDGYELRIINDSTFEFADTPEWKGFGDYKSLIINNMVDNESVDNYIKININQYEMIVPLLEKVFPFDINTGDFTSNEFLEAWNYLVKLSATNIQNNYRNTLGNTLAYKTTSTQRLALLKTKGRLITEIASHTDIKEDKVTRILSWITFNSQTPKKLSLFHCPLIEINENLFLVSTTPLIRSCVPTIFLRLFAHYNKKAYDSVSSKVEKEKLSEVMHHIGENDRNLIIGLKYKEIKKESEIDLVEYCAKSLTLSIVQSKFFISPDSVIEVAHANREIEKAFKQLKRNKENIEEGSLLDMICRRINIKTSDVQNINYYVIPTGFSGSDFLRIPDWIRIIPSNYCLSKKNKGKSLDKIWSEFHSLWKSLDEEICNGIVERFSFTVADMKIYAPGFEVTSN